MNKKIKFNCNKFNVEVKLSTRKGITLISLVITIILLIILAGVAVSLSLGNNGILTRAKQASEKYQIEQIREKVEMGIIEVQTREQNLENKVTIELMLQELLNNNTFESIDKSEKLGYIGEYEIKLKENVEGSIVIEYIKKSVGIKIIYELDPKSYTKNAKVTILFKVQGKVKSLTKPDKLKVYADKGVIETNYEVNANGTYSFLVEKEDGSMTTKEVIVDTIDKLPPNDFEIQVSAGKTGEINITATVSDAAADKTSVSSGIEKMEYYVKLSTESDYKKYDTNEIKGLPAGTYNVYAVAYDKAKNPKQSKNTPTVIIKEWVEIRTEKELRNMANGLNKNYILMENITLTSAWTAVGTYTNKFTGILEGNDKKITGLKVNTTKDYQGLFGYTSETAKISNLTLEGVVSTGTGSTGGSDVGMLVGYNCGRIENIKVSGTVTGHSDIGGLVGENKGTIECAYSSATVTGWSVGGLVSDNRGTIKKAASTGNVTSLYNNGCGGLVGSNTGNIENSYSTGTVKGNSYAGGFVGTCNSGTIKNSYTVSKVTGSYAFSRKGGTATYCYYSPQIAGVSTGNMGTAIAKASDMLLQSTYSGFDFDTIWIMKENEYPKLKWMEKQQ